MTKKAGNGDSRVVQWLLEKDQPAARYLALTRLLDKPEHDPEVKEARKAIAERGWAAQILKNQDSGGWWASEDSLYRPKYLSTNWMLLRFSEAHRLRPMRRSRFWNRGSDRRGSKAGRRRTEGLKRSA